MYQRQLILLVFFLIPFLVIHAGCHYQDAPRAGEKPLVLEMLETPVGAASAEPNLTVSPAGDAYLTWIERSESDDASLLMARFDGTGWTNPEVIAGGANWFVNWADFPALAVAGSRRMAAHFLAKSAESTYAYDIYMTTSDDGGRSWNAPFKPHQDGTQTEHGFVSLLPVDDGRFFATWLDGRNTGGHDSDGHGGGAMSIRAAFFDDEGNLSEEALLDARTCDCCQTSAVQIDDRIIVAYRDRSEVEIRDIAVVRYAEGAWSKPAVVHEDGWEIAGCPVNGPSLAASDDRVGLAWFTAADEFPRVQVAVSTDAGASFSTPVRIDNGAPLGRVDLIFLDDHRLLVSWLESVDADAAIRARVVDASDPASPTMQNPFMIARTSPVRQSGFPQMARTREGVVIAWTEVTGERNTTVRTAFIGDLGFVEMGP